MWLAFPCVSGIFQPWPCRTSCNDCSFTDFPLIFGFFPSSARHPPRELLGLQRLQWSGGDPFVHERRPHWLFTGAHPQSSGSEWESAQRSPRLQRLRKSRHTDHTEAGQRQNSHVWRLFQGLQDEEEEEGQLLGTYLYDEDGDALQTYSVSVSNSGLSNSVTDSGLWTEPDFHWLILLEMLTWTASCILSFICPVCTF